MICKVFKRSFIINRFFTMACGLCLSFPLSNSWVPYIFCYKTGWRKLILLFCPKNPHKIHFKFNVLFDFSIWNKSIYFQFSLWNILNNNMDRITWRPPRTLKPALLMMGKRSLVLSLSFCPSQLFWSKYLTSCYFSCKYFSLYFERTILLV